MKRSPCLIAFAALLVGCAGTSVDARKPHADDDFVPSTFETRQDVDRYIAALFAGGRADEVLVGRNRYLVLFRHGSGVPILGLVRVYVEKGRRWTFLKEAAVPRFEFANAEQFDGKIFSVGVSSGQKTLLYDPRG